MFRPRRFLIECDRSAAVQRHPRVVDYQLAGGEVLLLHLDSGSYHELNPVGAAIWYLLDAGKEPAEIAAELAHRLEDPPSELHPVVVEFLGALRERDLVA